MNNPLFKIEQFNIIHPKYNVGCIIDFETIGDFIDSDDLTLRHQNIKPFIIGIYNLSNACMTQYHLKRGTLNKEQLLLVLSKLSEPFYAFSALFERSITQIITGKDFDFRELQKSFSVTKTYYEKKQYLCNNQCIPNYDDPYDGDGGLCTIEFEKGEVEKPLTHNRSCLLKERDILYMRGYYKI